MEIINVNGVSKSFKTPIERGIIQNIFHPQYDIKTVVSDISFSISKGESVAFLGPNGAGKTTTTKMMTGLIYPTHGSISVLGFQPQKRDKEFLRNIGLVMGSKSGLNKELSALQTFEIYRRIYKIEIVD